MKVKDESTALQQQEDADDRSMPRKLTFAENAILTVKVLVAAGLVLAALWGLSVWTAAD
jgi:hypothetical protein